MMRSDPRSSHPQGQLCSRSAFCDVIQKKQPPPLTYTHFICEESWFEVVVLSFAIKVLMNSVTQTASCL